MGPGLVYLAEPNRTKLSEVGKGVGLEFAVTGMQGWRKNMEDAHCAITSFGGDPKAALFGVFDGHGGTCVLRNCFVGREVAEFASKHLPEELLKDPAYISGNYEKALKNVFLRIDELLSSEAGRKEVVLSALGEQEAVSPTKRGMVARQGEGAEMKGCTANVILVKNGSIVVANAGDSRCVLARNKKATDLSIDHKPDQDREIQRIIKAGGTVVEGRVEGNLNLSRALGDLHYKMNKSLSPEEQMISGEPDVHTLPISKDFDFVVMGCDGVYESRSSQELVDYFYKELSANGNKLTPAIEKLLDSMCSPDYMKTEGIGCDNMTCIVIKFAH